MSGVYWTGLELISSLIRPETLSPHPSPQWVMVFSLYRGSAEAFIGLSGFVSTPDFGRFCPLTRFGKTSLTRSLLSLAPSLTRRKRRVLTRPKGQCPLVQGKTRFAGTGAADLRDLLPSLAVGLRPKPLLGRGHVPSANLQDRRPPNEMTSVRGLPSKTAARPRTLAFDYLILV
jgi:hypothetical protein